MHGWLESYYIFVILSLAALLLLLFLAFIIALRRHYRELSPWRLADRLSKIAAESDLWLHIPRLAEDGGDFDYYLAGLNSRLARRRKRAARLLGTIGSSHAVLPLLGHLHDPNRAVRKEVVWALGELGDLKSLLPLLSLIETPDWGDPSIVIEAVIKFGPDAETSLLPLLTVSSPITQLWAARAIGRIRGEKPRPPIAPLRPPTAVDTILSWTKRVAWLISGLSMFALFITLLVGTLSATDAFARFVLRLALATIAFVFILILLNLAVRILSDRLEKSRSRLQKRARDVIENILKAPGDHDNWTKLKPFIKRLAIVAVVCQPIPEADTNVIRQILRELGAETHLEKQALRTRRKWRRFQALLLLGWLQSRKSFPLLERALYDPDIENSLAAAHALSEFDAAAAYRMLLDVLSDGRLPYSRLAAVIEASSFKEPLPLLCERVGDFRPKLRFWVAYLLGTTHDQKAFPALTKLARDSEANVRANAVESLGKLKDERATPLLRELLKDPTWYVRAHAAKGVGIANDTTLVEELTWLLHDEQWWVRQDSALALEKIGRPSIPFLKKLLNDKDRFARNKAAEVLGRLGVVAEQIEKLTGTSAETKEAGDFLYAIGRAEALNILHKEISQAEPGAQSRLADILGWIGNDKSLPLLEQLKLTGAQRVREHAKDAIDIIERKH